jgi:hypothetical protein
MFDKPIIAQPAGFAIERQIKIIRKIMAIPEAPDAEPARGHKRLMGKTGNKEG